MIGMLSVEMKHIPTGLTVYVIRGRDSEWYIGMCPNMQVGDEVFLDGTTQYIDALEPSWNKQSRVFRTRFEPG